MTGIRGRAAKAGLFAVEVLGVLIAALAAGAAFLAWRIQSGPVSLAAFIGSAEFAVERALPKGHRVDIADLSLLRGDGGGEFSISVSGAKVVDGSGREVAALSRLDASFSVGDAARGAFGPRRIVFNKPMIVFARGADGLIRTDAGAGDFDFLRLLKTHAWLRDSFRSASFRDAVIVYKDAQARREWRSDGAEAVLERTKEGFAAKASGEFETGRDSASLDLRASFDEKKQIIDARLKLADAPVGDLLEMFFGPAGALLKAPISGEATVRLTERGAVVSSSVDLKSGAGRLQIGDQSIAVNAASIRTVFDPVNRRFADLDAAIDMDGFAGRFSGDVVLAPGTEEQPVGAIEFDLVGEDLVLAPGEFFAEPLKVLKIAAAGRYDAGAGEMILSALRAELLDVVIAGDASVTPSPKGEKSSPAMRAKLRIDGALDPERIAKGWPQHLGTATREFIATRLPRARVDNVAFTLDLPAGALAAGKALADDALTLTFDIADADAVIAPGMAPLTGAGGKAKLTGNMFRISGVTGNVGKVAITEGEVDFTQISPKGAPVNYTFSADGAVSDILKVLNDEPLRLLKDAKLAPEQFSGSAKARVTITRPNLRVVEQKDYRYAGKATFRNVTVSEFYRGADLSKANGSLDLRSRSMTIRADAEFGEAPIKIDWLQRFYDVDGLSKFSATGIVDSSTGDLFGVPTRQMLRGPVAYKADVEGRIGSVRKVRLEADFRDAAVTIDAFGWRKPQGTPVVGALDLDFEKSGPVLSRFSMAGEGVGIAGSARFDANGAVETAQFDRFELEGAADFTAAATRRDGAVMASINGRFLNASGLVKSLISSRPSETDRPDPWGNIRLAGRVEEIALQGDARFRNASIDVARQYKILEALDFSADTLSGAPVTVQLKTPAAPADEPQSGVARVVEAKSGDIGALLAGVFGVTSVKGGEGELELRFHQKSEAGPGVIEGTARARGLRVVKAPLLARIFAAGSFDGLADLINGDGIEIAKARSEFSFKNGVLSLRNARATGPSVGITGEGDIGSGPEGEISLKGAVAPAYPLNSLLGKTPLVGDIFVNRRGEGLLAIAYDVSGAPSSPTVTVNPLSALTPGVLRRMFETREEAPPKTAEE